ncbi:MAG TPA: FAD:protein FMN transferase [Clostridiaceae bacterium]
MSWLQSFFNIKSTYAQRKAYALGTIIQLRAYGRKSEKAIEEAVTRLNQIDDKMSYFKEDSEISKINKAAGVSPQVVSEETFLLLNTAVKYSELSQGAFDPTIRPLVNLWGIGSGFEDVPTKEEIDTTLKLINYEDIILDKSNNSVLLKTKGQSLDLGGIAKGYATDAVKNIFIRNNIKSGLIDLGGNIYALGGKQDGTPWRVGIQDPYAPRGGYIGVVTVKDKSVVTSGYYEKYYIKSGRTYHHIIDPRTGYPSESNLISATIISDKSLDGDGLSTGLYIMGVTKATKLIEAIPGVDAIFITNAKEVYTTSGIKNIFQLTNTEYKYINNPTSKGAEIIEIKN